MIVIVEKMWPEKRIISTFITHDIEHSYAVANYSYQIMLPEFRGNLSGSDLFLLLAAILLHDIGMQCDPGKWPEVYKIAKDNYGAKFESNIMRQYNCLLEKNNSPERDYELTPDQKKDIRNNHHKLTAAWIKHCFDTNKCKNKDADLFKILQQFPELHRDELIKICLFHSKEDIKNYTGEKPILAAILRLSDELDMTSSRSYGASTSFNLSPKDKMFWWLLENTEVNLEKGIINITLMLNNADDDLKDILTKIHIDNFFRKNVDIFKIMEKEGIVFGKHYKSAVKLREEFSVAKMDKEVREQIIKRYNEYEQEVGNTSESRRNYKERENEAMMVHPETIKTEIERKNIKQKQWRDFYKSANREIDLMGHVMSGTIKEEIDKEIIKELIIKGCKIRFLILNPKTPTKHQLQEINRRLPFDLSDRIESMLTKINEIENNLRYLFKTWEVKNWKKLKNLLTKNIKVDGKTINLTRHKKSDLINMQDIETKDGQFFIIDILNNFVTDTDFCKKSGLSEIEKNTNLLDQDLYEWNRNKLKAILESNNVLFSENEIIHNYESNGKIMIKVTDELMYSCISRVDDKMYVTHYSINPHGDKCPTFYLDKNNSNELFEFYKKEFDEIWKNAIYQKEIDTQMYLFGRVSQYYKTSENLKKLICSNRTPQKTLPFPKMAILYLTYSCSAKCPNCMYKELRKEIEKNGQEMAMNKDLFKHIIKDLGQFGIYNIELSGGGDPLEHEDFTDFLSEILKHEKLKFGILTNGLKISTFDDDIVLKMIRAFKYVRLSYPEFATSEHNPGTKKQFYKSLTRLITLREKENGCKTRIGVKVLVTRENQKRIINIIREIYKFKIDHVKVKSVRSEDNFSEQELLEIEERLYEFKFNNMKKYSDFQIDIRKTEFPPKVFRDGSTQSPEKRFICWINPLITVIDPHGRVFICYNYHKNINEMVVGRYKKENKDLFSITEIRDWKKLLIQLESSSGDLRSIYDTIASIASIGKINKEDLLFKKTVLQVLNQRIDCNSGEEVPLKDLATVVKPNRTSLYETLKGVIKKPTKYYSIADFWGSQAHIDMVKNIDYKKVCNVSCACNCRLINYQDSIDKLIDKHEAFSFESYQNFFNEYIKERGLSDVVRFL